MTRLPLITHRPPAAAQRSPARPIRLAGRLRRFLCKAHRTAIPQWRRHRMVTLWVADLGSGLRHQSRRFGGRDRRELRQRRDRRSRRNRASRPPVWSPWSVARRDARHALSAASMIAHRGTRYARASCDIRTPRHSRAAMRRWTDRDSRICVISPPQTGPMPVVRSDHTRSPGAAQVRPFASRLQS